MKGTKSKERVQKHGEVFTPDSIVNAMLNMVDSSLTKEDANKYIKALVLEPSCGNGNFLIRILDRKLEVVQKYLPEKDWNIGLLWALSSIYGVDIQADNVAESKERMLELIENGSVDILELPDVPKLEFNFKKYTLTPDLRKAVTKILDLNIIHGNCLSGNKWKGNNAEGITEYESVDDPFIFIDYHWNGDNLTCTGHTIEDVNVDCQEDRCDNKGKIVHYSDLDKLNFEYSTEVTENFEDLF